MARFTIRVELRNAASLSDRAYQTLHDSMEKAHYYRKIYDAVAKIWYDLPPAEYQCISDTMTVGQVRNAVAAIAQTVDPRIRVVVTAGEWASYGLEKSAWQGGPTVKAAAPRV